MVPQSRTLSMDYSFDGSSFVIDTAPGRIQFTKGVLRADSVLPSEVLRWVMMMMRPRALRGGVSLVHAAAVSRDCVGILFPAWTHTGKTNVTLSFLKNGYDYVANDWCFVAASGELLGYPRFPSLHDYNFDCHPFLLDVLGKTRKGGSLRRQLSAMRFARSLNGRNWLSGILQRRLLDRYYLDLHIPVSDIVHGCRTALHAPLSKVCLLTTARHSGCAVSEISPEALAEKVVWNGRYERLWFHKAHLAMAYVAFGESPEEPASVEMDILTRAFRGATCVEVTLPPAASAREVDQVRELVEGT